MVRKDGSIDFHACTFCALKELQLTLKKRDICITPSWDYHQHQEPLCRPLRQRVAGMLPRVNLPGLILEIDARTNFTSAFTHSSEQSSRVSDLNISICAMLMAEACNTGPEPFMRHDVAALKRDRLTWTDSNYIRDETMRAANTILVAAQSGVPLANIWGGSEVASADSMRFVVPGTLRDSLVILAVVPDQQTHKYHTQIERSSRE